MVAGFVVDVDVAGFVPGFGLVVVTRLVPVVVVGGDVVRGAVAAAGVVLAGVAAAGVAAAGGAAFESVPT